MAYAEVVDVLCQGCGACVVACPNKASQQKGFEFCRSVPCSKQPCQNFKVDPRNVRVMMTDTSFEPKIIAFLCNWCTYTGADLAGTSRLQYPPNVRIIRLMCSGAVDPIYVLKADLAGADGILIGGCHPGDCHYQEGNYKARRRVVAMKEILKNAGFSEDRVWLRWISASEGQRFADTISEMTAAIREMGPNPLKQEWAV
jgi:F420-non-reducing hydrogenase iron-sulfur subunit